MVILWDSTISRECFMARGVPVMDVSRPIDGQSTDQMFDDCLEVVDGLVGS